MKITLEKNYGEGKKEFNNKNDLINYIKEELNYKMQDDFYDYIKFNGLSSNLNKWTINELVDYFFADYKRL